MHKYGLKNDAAGFKSEHIYDMDISYDENLSQYCCKATYDHTENKNINIIIYLSSRAAIQRYFIPTA